MILFLNERDLSMKFILISPKNRTVYNFRGDLLKDIIARGYEVIVTGPDRIDVDKIEALGARFVEIPMQKNGTDPIKDIKYLQGLVSLFRKEKPDAVLGYTVKPVVYGMTAAGIAGVKNKTAMITGIGYAFTAETAKAKIIKAITSAMYRVSLTIADTVIFQNPDNRNLFLEEKLVNRRKCRLVHGSGVNLDYYTVAPYPEQITFFMLSRVMYSKGIREYLAAAEKVKAVYPEARFLLLGAVENIQDSMRQSQIDDFVDRGIIEHFGETEDVRPYYAMSSVYVLPSYAEGTPRTVLEAMCMGRPVITTDAPGCRETVLDGKTGYLVPVKDSDILADRMIRFIENPDLIGKMGKKSRKYAEKKFDVHKVNEKMIEHMRL